MTDLPARVKELRAKMTPGPWQVVENRREWSLPSTGASGAHIERRIFTKWEHPQLEAPVGVVNGSVGLGPHYMVHMNAEDAAAIALLPELMDAYLEAVEARAVTVKPLVWEDGDEPGEYRSGSYDIWNEQGGFQIYHWSIVLGEQHSTPEAAQAAAQADHDARIRSALDVQPVTVNAAEIPRGLVDELAQWVQDEQAHWPPDTPYQEDLATFAKTLRALAKGDDHE